MLPFVHAHKTNKEVCIIISGRGSFYVGGEEFAIKDESLIRVSPAAECSIKADEEDLFYIYVQTNDNSLTQSAKK